MATDWIHCNSCITLPSANVQFAFSSCGHIVCKKCLAKNQSQPIACPYCKKNAQFVEINRSLKAEIQMLFRNPRDLAGEYMKNLSTVLDFQNSHRSRLTRAKNEQQKKAMKYVSAAQGEVKKRIEAEKKAMEENTEIRNELEKTKTHVQKLEALLAARELELDRIRASHRPSPHIEKQISYQRSGMSSDSGLGDTPFSSLSFIDALTSTPINSSPSSHRSGSSDRRRSRDRLKDIFQSSNGSVPSPIVRHEDMVTPAMLGINKKRSSSENNRKTPPGGFIFEEAMDMAGGF